MRVYALSRQSSSSAQPIIIELLLSFRIQASGFNVDENIVDVNIARTRFHLSLSVHLLLCILFYPV